MTSKQRLRRATFFQVIALLLWSLAAGSREPFRVVFVSTPGEGTVIAPLVLAELRTAGFVVTTRTAGAVPTPEDLERSVTETGSIAAIAVTQENDEWVALVWIAGEAGHPGFRTVTASRQSEEGARLLSLRVAELLYAQIVEVPGTASEAAPPAVPEDTSPSPPEEVATAAPTLAAPSPRVTKRRQNVRRALRAGARRAVAQRYRTAEPAWSAALGPSVIGGPGGMPVGIAPLLMVSRRVTPIGFVELVGAGPVIGNVTDAVGDATVDQELLLVRGRVAPASSSWAPYLAAGAGVYRVGARGEGVEGYAGRTVSAYGALMACGLGLRWHATRDLRLLAETDAAIVLPRPVLRFGGRSSAATPAPLLLGTLALELAW